MQAMPPTPELASANAGLSAEWFDGVTPKPQPCELWVQNGELVLTTATQTRRFALIDITWPEPTRHGQRVLLLRTAGVVQTKDTAAFDAFAAAAGFLAPVGSRWANSWRAAGAASVVLLALMFGAWRWGIPWAAEVTAQWVPHSLQARLGQRVLKDLEERGWLQPSEVPAAEQQRLQDNVAQMVARAYPQGTAPLHELHLRKTPKWLGPNAFALPGGTIVVTDELVRMLRRDDGALDPALLGVVAHELGHVRAQHGLRLVFEAGAFSALMGLWIGDYSAVLAGAPALAAQAHYARKHERAADDEALRVMRAADIDPRAMVSFFKALAKTVPEREGNDHAFGLASHPSDDERIRFFELGAR